MNEMLQRINCTDAFCWHCRKGVSREELMIIEEIGTTIAELCYACYEETMMN
ncbi:hypothetical protein H0266_11465 [Halobacillus locisalis]|uniref:Uncharacterized protein n=1 Tax=Halobacillus locisalis TaxID=220753 RepID=A0A838CTP2_9BACI|nr:hypothetical protein [Halobacillus locisalis]MBA2175512.1 hypothetical protein [Halobacillus locisalis]